MTATLLTQIQLVKYMEIKDVTTLIFMDRQLKVTKDDSQSKDTVTTYVAASYTYENPAFPGGSYNTDQIKITVTDNADNTQTIRVEIPAALIPLRVNTITLDGRGEPANNTSTGNLPLRLCYEVGLEDELIRQLWQELMKIISMPTQRTAR